MKPHRTEQQRMQDYYGFSVLELLEDTYNFVEELSGDAWDSFGNALKSLNGSDPDALDQVCTSTTYIIM
jgi:hypothetical protein